MAVGIMASAVHIAVAGPRLLPVQRGAGTSDADQYGTGRTVARPAGLVATDVVILVARSDRTGGNFSTSSDISSAGFTRIFEQRLWNSSDNFTMELAILVGTGFSGAGTFSMTAVGLPTTDYLSTTCTAWSNCTIGDIVVGPSIALLSGSGTEVVPAVTTQTPNSVLLLIGGQVFGGVDGITASTPATTNLVSNNGVIQRYRTQAIAGSSGTSTITCMASQSIISLQIGVAGRVWTPLDMTGPELWLDPFDATKYTLSGAEMLTWTDKTPNAFVATTTGLTTPQRPTLNASINGKTAVAFNGSQWLRTNAPATIKPFTFGIVVNLTAGTQDRSFLGSSGAAAPGDGGWHLRASNTDDTFVMNTSNTAQVVQSTAVPEGTPTLITFTYNSTGGWVLRYNGVQQGAATNNATPTASRNWLVGNNNYNTATEAFTGAIGDIVLSDTAPLVTDVVVLEEFLATRWGITIAKQPHFVSAGTFQAEESTTALGPVTLPTGLVANDIMFLNVMLNAAGTFSTPAGWTQFGTLINSANQSSNWFWKRYVVGDTAPSTTTSVTMSTTLGGYGRIYAFRGCIATGTPFEATANAGTPTSSTTPASSAITTLGTNRLVVSFAVVDNSPLFTSGSPPTLWSPAGVAVNSTLGADAMFTAICRPIATASAAAAVNHGTLAAATYWRTLTTALIPA